MKRRIESYRLLGVLGGVLAVHLLTNPVPAQSTATPAQNPTGRQPQVRPVSLAHLYWHFLVLQNVMDTKAAGQQSQGKDGGGLRNSLQKTLGWSDAEYSPIRTSSGRLTAEVKDLDAQVAAIRKAGPAPSSMDQLKALTAQREVDINAEVSFLRQNLPAEKIKTFEIFLTRFFSPANGTLRQLHPTTPGQSAPAAVHQ